MKVIDLLNKIANGEEVSTIIKYKHNIWTYRNDVKDYTDETQFFFGEYIFQEDTQKELNEEVEIIEEEKKIPEKSILDVDRDASGRYDAVIINGAEYQISRVERYVLGKINEIIDFLEEDK